MSSKTRTKLSAAGLPIDGRDWNIADWKDLHEAIEKAKRLVRERHEFIEGQSDDPCRLHSQLDL